MDGVGQKHDRLVHGCRVIMHCQRVSEILMMLLRYSNTVCFSSTTCDATLILSIYRALPVLLKIILLYSWQSNYIIVLNLQNLVASSPFYFKQSEYFNQLRLNHRDS